LQGAAYDPGRHWATSNADVGGYTDWPANVEVLASSSQRHYSGKLITSRTGLYTNSLLDTIALPSIQSLPEAHGVLEESGYKTHPEYPDQVPVSTFNTNNIDHERACQSHWAKDAPIGTVRFALLLGNGDDFTSSLSQMQQMLQNVYGLDDQQMNRYNNVTLKEFSQGLQQLAQQVKTAKHHGLTPEVLIYYTGHGGIQPGDDKTLYTPSFKEGAAKGAIDLADGTLNEDIVKQKMKHFLPNVNTLFILDTCQSGSWTG
jgi:hypothetical protein